MSDNLRRHNSVTRDDIISRTGMIAKFGECTFSEYLDESFVFDPGLKFWSGIG